MENSPVQVTNTFRYLGVVLDNKLLFRNHINTLERKIARSIGIIAKLRHYVPISCQLTNHISINLHLFKTKL